MYLLLALIAAIVFALGSMVFKRAFAEGAGIVHALVVNNLVLGILFLPLLAFDPKPVAWHLWLYPFLTGLAFMVGHLLNVVSIRLGDVSVVTPLLGAKVVFVGLLGWVLFGTQLSNEQWIASALATLGVVVMGRTDTRTAQHAARSVALAMGCAAAFAMTDVFIQAWGSQFGVFHFLPLQFAALGLLSAATLPYFGWRSLRAPARAWLWIGAAAFLSAIQAILITAAIAIWKDASGVNIVYATRGLWSIALVWVIGHWMQNSERIAAGNRIMGIRLLGAALILMAVVLTSFQQAK